MHTQIFELVERDIFGALKYLRGMCSSIVLYEDRQMYNCVSTPLQSVTERTKKWSQTFVITITLNSSYLLTNIACNIIFMISLHNDTH